MSETTTIILGVLSGIILSFLGLVIKKIAIPYIQSLFSDINVNLSGTWQSEVTNPSGNTQKMIMNIKQFGTNIEGSIQVEKHLKENNEIQLKNFIIDGTAKNRILILNAWNKDKKAFGVATLLLEIIGDASIMKGSGIWYSATESIIREGAFAWRKIPAQQ